MNNKSEMKSSILSKKQEDLHTKYISCGQYINWNLDGLSISKSEQVFIVQELCIKAIPLNEYVEPIRYYEAWEVKGGIVVSTKDDYCDDMFRVGNDFDEDNLIKNSMGKSGMILFMARVYVVRNNSELYNCVNNWPLEEVKQANGLRASKVTSKLQEEFKNMPVFERDIFRHDWRFDDPEDIYEEVLDYCRNLKYSKNDVDRLFPDEGYEDIKNKVKKNLP